MNKLQKFGVEIFDGSNWNKSTTKLDTLCMIINYSMKTEIGEVYECNSNYLDLANPDGIAMETKEK